MTPFDSIFRAASEKWGVPWTLFEATARTESSLRPDIVTNEPGGKKSYGLFQILDSTARGLGFTGDLLELLDPVKNTDLAGKLMREILDRQRELNLANFYSEYNSGRAQLWRTSSQVAGNVARFLRHFATTVGIELPAGTSIDAALVSLSAVPASGALGLMFVLALIFFFKK